MTKVHDNVGDPPWMGAMVTNLSLALLGIE